MGFDQPGFWDNFWPGFWGNFLADVLVAVLLVSLLARLGQLFRQPKAILEAVVVPSGDPSGWVYLDLAINNRGRLNFGPRELYFQIWLDNTIEVEWSDMSCAKMVEATHLPDEAFYKDAKFKWQHIQGHLDANIFPGMAFHFLGLKVRPLRTADTEIRWFFSTIYGFLPRRHWRAKLWIRFLHLIRRGDEEGRYFGIITFRTTRFHA